MAEKFKHSRGGGKFMFTAGDKVQIVSVDGNVLGDIKGVYLDRVGDVRSCTVKLPGKQQEKIVPLRNAVQKGGKITIAYGADVVKRAPSVETGHDLDEPTVRRVGKHYGSGDDVICLMGEPILIYRPSVRQPPDPTARNA